MTSDAANVINYRVPMLVSLAAALGMLAWLGPFVLVLGDQSRALMFNLIIPASALLALSRAAQHAKREHWPIIRADMFTYGALTVLGAMLYLTVLMGLALIARAVM